MIYQDSSSNCWLSEHRLDSIILAIMQHELKKENKIEAVLILWKYVNKPIRYRYKKASLHNQIHEWMMGGGFLYEDSKIKLNIFLDSISILDQYEKEQFKLLII